MERIVNALGKSNRCTSACGAFALCFASAITLPAQTFTTLVFDGADGADPEAVLVQAADGDLYGTTEMGGARGRGTVFKITPSGTLTTLHSFCAQGGCTDGEAPDAGLIQDANGDFYGTTAVGGVSGNGTVFKIAPSGTLTALYSFCSQSDCTDGLNPKAGLARVTNGDFYGTTLQGGAVGSGTVFRLTRSGTLTTLYSALWPGKANPRGRLARSPPPQPLREQPREPSPPRPSHPEPPVSAHRKTAPGSSGNGTNRRPTETARN